MSMTDYPKQNKHHCSKDYRQLGKGGILYVYISVCSRLDIAFALSILTQQFSNLTHFELTLWVLKYLLGTNNVGLILGRQVIPKFFAFFDASFANDSDDKKSTRDVWPFWGILKFHGWLESIKGSNSTKHRVRNCAGYWDLQQINVGATACKGLRILRYQNVNHTYGDHQSVEHIVLNDHTNESAK